MKRPTNAELGIGMLGLAETIGTMGNLCPTVPDLIRRVKDGDCSLRGDLNQAYLRSAFLSLAIAGGAGLLSASWWPLVGWGLGLGVATVTYESCLPKEQHLLYQLLLPSRDPNVIDLPRDAWRVVS